MCRQTGKKTLFPLIVPHLLLYSAHIQFFLQVLLPDLFLPSLIQISWLINPKEFIQDNFLFTVPKVLPLTCTWWLQGVVYAFFYRLHPQFVLFFPKNSTTESVLHLWVEFFFYFSPNHARKSKSQNKEKKMFFFKENKELVKTALPVLLDLVN